MGVDQVGGRLEVSVVEWSDAGERSAFFDGVISGSTDALRTVLALTELFAVKRALVDPHPDAHFAKTLIAIRPEVFALQVGSQHNGASLAEAAWRRMQAATLVTDDAGGDMPHVVSLEADPIDPLRVVARAYVPPGHPATTHLMVDLKNADVMERSDGSRIVEAVLPLAQITTMAAGAAKQAAARQIWSLAPTTSLPTRGWSLVLSLYGANGLIHEQVVTVNQMMGLGNLVEELTRDAADWLDRTTLPGGGPYWAEYTAYAGKTPIHTETTAQFTQAPGLMTALRDKDSLARTWIFDNAVAMEQAHPGINLPEDALLPDLVAVQADTYDYPQ